MGNALVVGVIERIGKVLARMHRDALERGAKILNHPTPSPLTTKVTNPTDKRMPLRDGSLTFN